MSDGLRMVVGLGGLAIAGGAVWGVVRLAKSGHPWMAALVGFGAGSGGLWVAHHALSGETGLWAPAQFQRGAATPQGA